MTYLTQLLLDHASAARLGLRDCYDWHQRVWQCFPGRDGAARDFLTRLDRRPEGFRLLIVSAACPTRPAWCPSDAWGCREISPGYFSHARYAFHLCANPTKKVTKLDPNGSPTKNGKRVPLRSREEYVAWLVRKAEAGGFVPEVASLRTIPQGREYFAKPGMQGFHSAVEFQGVLSVTDSARFHETFTRGVGSAKAFGFGLLVIVPTV